MEVSMTLTPELKQAVERTGEEPVLLEDAGGLDRSGFDVRFFAQSQSQAHPAHRTW
jgi:hypothetical protein